MSQKAAEKFDKITEAPTTTSHGFWGSVRMTYTICAFLAMIVNLCMRNTLNFVILCMVKNDSVQQKLRNRMLALDPQCPIAASNGTTSVTERTGDLEWTRAQEISLLGAFYYGYLITLPIAGRLADKFGGKLFFVHSITGQSLIFMLLPCFARISYMAAVAVRVLQGLVAGCGNSAIYQLFSIWSHSTERTALISFAFGGYSVGALLAFPISSFLCQFGWQFAFYSIGAVSLLFGICCQWLVYSSLDTHPRLSPEEYEYLNSSNIPKSGTSVPWKAILTSVPVYAFILTHLFHSYGIIVYTLIIPRFFNEALQYSLAQTGVLSSAPFLGAIIAMGITSLSCNLVERRLNLNMTKFRRILYVTCNVCIILLILGIVFCSCEQRAIVIILTLIIGMVSHIAFAGCYWVSLLSMAPSYAGLLSGGANCLATISGFVAPLLISMFVLNGTKSEWNYVMITLIAFYGLGALVYGLFGSSKLQKWDPSYQKNECEG